MTDRLLAGRYRVGERIGGGGMSLVYRADDLQLGREVAVKVLRGQFGNDEEFVRRFRREAQNAASLSHPNVVQIYDVGEEDGQYYIVMELVQGSTLKQLIQEQGPLPVADAARIAVEVLAALAHAHMHRIVHRDVKPHNILISRDGRVKVTDFGIARAITTDTVTRTGSIMGSAHYFSPEQANGQPTGEKSDLYSVGVVLYEMVTGAVPFQGESPITVALKHLREEPVPPAQLNPEVPLELQQIVMRALEKEPDDRFPSADAMRAALQQFVVDHAAGRTHIHSGDFPTMDLRAMKGLKVRREIDGDGRPAVKNEKVAAKRRRRRWVLALVLLLLAAGIVYGLTYGAMKILNVPEVAVPNIVNMPLPQAQQVLTDAKLSWKALDPKFSETVPQGSVISTDPEPGQMVKQGRPINLVLSKGPEMRQVPDVRNKNIDDAKNQLESSRFKVGDVKPMYSPTVPVNQVIDMSPPPLSNLNAGSVVNLVVSLGPLKVPKVMGKSLTEAQTLLTQANLVTGRLDYKTDVRPKDTVIGSDPAQDTPVGQGSTVNLTLSLGSTATGKSFTQSIIVSGQAGTTHTVAVNLVDQVNGVATEQMILPPSKANAGDKIPVQGTYFGDAYLKVIIDGKDVQHVDLGQP
ncbi:MAG: Stk1 family PASTA domain-containing Ser/Thr kinase [Mycobacterium leprae]